MMHQFLHTVTKTRRQKEARRDHARVHKEVRSRRKHERRRRMEARMMRWSRQERTMHYRRGNAANASGQMSHTDFFDYSLQRSDATYPVTKASKMFRRVILSEAMLAESPNSRHGRLMAKSIDSMEWHQSFRTLRHSALGREKDADFTIADVLDILPQEHAPDSVQDILKVLELSSTRISSMWS